MAHSSLNAGVRYPAVAGLFYPEDPDALRDTLDRLLANAHVDVTLPAPPKALIVPHAGYPYSGPVAAAAYSLLDPLRDRIKRVVLLGPSHRVYVRGIAMPQAHSFATPLGDIAIDNHLRGQLVARGDVLASDTPHELEHCLEVQLPFLQRVLDEFTLLPLVVGSTTPDHVATVLADAWGGAETLVLASSDLSHYLSYDSARAIDSTTAQAIVNRQSDLTHEQACGASALNGVLMLARRYGLDVTEIARLNSGDTAGNTNRVVGYGAFAIHAANDHARQRAS